MTVINRSIMVLLIALFSTSAPIAKQSPPGPEISQVTLSNGLRVVVIPDLRAPVVTHMIWYAVGAADDPPGKSGLAHFLEHLMFKGTTNTPAGEFSRAVSEIGGQENAFTSHDYTGYYQKVSPEALGQMMAYEADRMRNLTLREEVVSPERDVILEERSSRVDSSPSAILSEFSQAALYVHHPYGVPIIGWEHEIVDLQREDALAFYEKWYQPWNAIVVVAGDVKKEDVFELARNTYGQLEASSPPIERKRLKDPQPVVSKSLQYADARVTTPVWRKTFLAPSYRTAKGTQAEALDLLATILGNSVSSRIYRKLVLEQELATSAGAFYQGAYKDMGYFGLYATPRGEATLAEVAQAVQNELDLILAEGITQEELDRARKAYLNTLVFSQDSQVAMARIFGSILSTGGTVEDFQQWPEDLRRVTVEDVNIAARKYLLETRAVTTQLLPKEE